MTEPLPLTRRIPVTKGFYMELDRLLEPDEWSSVNDGEIGPKNIVLWTDQKKRLIFYYQEPVVEPEKK